MPKAIQTTKRSAKDQYEKEVVVSESIPVSQRPGPPLYSLQFLPNNTSIPSWNSTAYNMAFLLTSLDIQKMQDIQLNTHIKSDKAHIISETG